MFDIPNPVKLVSDAANFVGDGLKAGATLVADTAKLGTDLLVKGGTKVATPIIDLIAQPFRPGVFDLAQKPTVNTSANNNTGDPLLDSTLNTIGPLNKEIADLTAKLATATPEEKMVIMLQIQQKSQLVQQLVNMTTDLSKQKSDIAIKIGNNFR